MVPAEGVDAGDVEDLAWSAVRDIAIEDDVSLVVDNLRNEHDGFAHGVVNTGTNVNRPGLIVVLHEMQARAREVVDVEKFTQRRTVGESADFKGVYEFRFVQFAHDLRNRVAVCRMEVVSWAIDIGRHRRNEITSILRTVGIAHFDAGDFCYRIGIVCRLKRPRHQVFFLDGLWAELRIDAGRAEEEEFFNLEPATRIDDVRLNPQVVQNEVSREGVVGSNAANFCCGEKDVSWFLCSKIFQDLMGVREVELVARCCADVGVALPFEFAHDGAADEAVVPSDKNLCIFVHELLLRKECGEANLAVQFR